MTPERGDHGEAELYIAFAVVVVVIAVLGAALLRPLRTSALPEPMGPGNDVPRANALVLDEPVEIR